MTEVPASQTLLVARLASNSLRLDGRGLNDPRIPKILFPAGTGFVEAVVGETRVTCHATAEIITPKVFPHRGDIKVDVFNCSGTRDISSPLLKDILLEILRDSGCINLEALCIKAGEAVWSIKCSVCVLNDDGGLEYASCLAAAAAIMHMDILLTELTPDGEVLVYDSNERTPGNVQLVFVPVCFTGTAVDLKDPNPTQPQQHLLVVDPTLVEMSLSPTVVFVSCSHYGIPIKMEKVGHGGGMGDLSSLLMLTKSKAPRLGDILMKATQVDITRRRTATKDELKRALGIGERDTK